jgi:hypothetical protein
VFLLLLLLFSWFVLRMIRVKVQLPPRLADDHEGLVPWQGDAVGETEAVEHDGRLAVARVVPEEAAGGAGL